MKEKILKAIKERYGDVSTLKMAMWECTDTVICNLEDDIDYELEGDDLLIKIHEIVK